MAAQWTDNELNTLAQNLADGLPAQRMENLIPDRSLTAIIKRAQDFDYGIKTSKEDGIIRFYADIKSRVRYASASTGTDEVDSIINAIEVAQPAQAVPNHSIDYLEPETRIVPYDGFAANARAVKILAENSLDGDPDVVCMLAKHILKSMS
jgi:hypothetical protein